jgi:hypothetical protein
MAQGMLPVRSSCARSMLLQKQAIRSSPSSSTCNSAQWSRLLPFQSLRAPLSRRSKLSVDYCTFKQHLQTKHLLSGIISSTPHQTSKSFTPVAAALPFFNKTSELHASSSQHHLSPWSTMSAHFHRLQRSTSPFAPAILPNRVTSSSTASSSQTAVNHLDRPHITSGTAISSLELTVLALVIIGLVGWLGFLVFQYSIKKAEEDREARGTLHSLFSAFDGRRESAAVSREIWPCLMTEREDIIEISRLLGREVDCYHLYHRVCYPQLVCIHLCCQIWVELLRDMTVHRATGRQTAKARVRRQPCVERNVRVSLSREDAVRSNTSYMRCFARLQKAMARVVGRWRQCVEGL